MFDLGDGCTNKCLKPYIALVDFLGGLMGPDCEVVLQDISDPMCSIVAISNGHISGRDVGGPLTNKALRFLNDPNYENKQFMANYSGKSVSGKALRSSTYFIRDEDGKLQGFLCINQDQDRLRQFRDVIDEMLGEPHIVADNETENMANSVEDLALDSIESTIKSYGVDPERLSVDEKVEIIKRLNKSSIFLLKGSVSIVSKFLKISEPTVYRYLTRARNEYK